MVPGRGRVWSPTVGGAGEEVRGLVRGPRWGQRCGQLRWESGHWSGWVGALGDRRRGVSSVTLPLIQAGSLQFDNCGHRRGRGCPQGPASSPVGSLAWPPPAFPAGGRVGLCAPSSLSLSSASAPLKPIIRPISPGLPPPPRPPRLPEGPGGPSRGHPPQPPSSLHPQIPQPLLWAQPGSGLTAQSVVPPVHGHPRLSLRAACTALPIGPNLPVGPTSVDWFLLSGPRKAEPGPRRPRVRSPRACHCSPLPPVGRSPLLAYASEDAPVAPPFSVLSG